jgi:predicted TIM-barrel fold metal-dependent hydrolase
MGLPDYAQFLDLAADYERVYLDTTMVFTPFTEVNHPFPPALRPRLVDLGERIVFGSAYPNIPYPYLEGITAVTGPGLGQQWVRAVLNDNASRLFGLSQPPTPPQQETHRARI